MRDTGPGVPEAERGRIFEEYARVPGETARLEGTGLGLAMSRAGVGGGQVVAAGVALFLALPVLRVLVMLGAFLLEQDYRLVLVAAAVLLTILAGLLIGLSSASPLAH